ncbi:type II toxin-antitoxin system VapC family toxin [Telmatospirillum siberiense]|uniref:Ribonuclease VapC n=1 Tax=Telmatospirillum siberiense TaxID=382514 RepID=A0A2N3PS43_9PROT|nr:type II toxin-antitoxin system VapC family toxin [Telmatospirillum siberiense]PKU23215.1 VapC toxin family PIN domain ribonuclease [Telmatospirillum siberiense]
MFLLDTNVVSALRRPDTVPESVVSWAAEVAVADLYLSAMTLYELELGVRRIERRDQTQGQILRNWLARSVRVQFRDRILPIDDAVAARCASLQVHDPREERDSFIGATALVHRLVLVTRNVKDFATMAGLEILNPWDRQ